MTTTGDQIVASEAERIAEGLTKAQRGAIYPGPGNPDYARGPAGTMRALNARGVVREVAHYSSGDGKRGGLLTDLGLEVRVILQQRFPAPEQRGLRTDSPGSI